MKQAVNEMNFGPFHIESIHIAKVNHITPSAHTCSLSINIGIE